jgi:hypothetical protein
MGLIIGIVAALLVLGVGAVVFVNVFGSNTRSPEAAAEAFMEAVKSGDAEEVKDLMCEAIRADLEAQIGDRTSMMSLAQFEYDLGAVTVNGDTATVPVSMTITFMGESISDTGTMHLVKEDGGWRVCDL